MQGLWRVFRAPFWLIWQIVVLPFRILMGVLGAFLPNREAKRFQRRQRVARALDPDGTYSNAGKYESHSHYAADQAKEKEEQTAFNRRLQRLKPLMAFVLLLVALILLAETLGW